MKWVALVMVALAACGSVGGNNNKMDARPADSRAIDSPVDGHSLARCNPNAAFGTPVAIDELNTTSAEGAPSLSPDELTMYFYSNRTGAGTVGGNDIYVARRTSLTTPFGAPAVLAGVNTTGEEEVPSITADGLFLYFDRFTPNTTGWDIWVAQRASTNLDFGTPTMISSPLNMSGAVEDDNQSVVADNSAMYIISNRDGTIRDIYRATRNVGGTFDTPVPINPTPTFQEVSVAVTPDELTLYFSSDATGTLGTYDIWMEKRSTTADGFGTPQHITELSSTASDLVTWVSADGCDLYFQRDVASRSYDIFMASRGM